MVITLDLDRLTESQILLMLDLIDTHEEAHDSLSISVVITSDGSIY